MVGDLAIFMVKNDLTPDNICEKGKNMAFPDSVEAYFKGMLGQPPGGFPEDIQKIVLKGEEPITVRPGTLLEDYDFETAAGKVAAIHAQAGQQLESGELILELE